MRRARPARRCSPGSAPTSSRSNPPGRGDPGRHTERGAGDSLYFLTFNHNKRSVTLDLTTDEGRRIFLELVKRFDVVTENFTLGTMERLGLGYDALRAANPRIIYGTIKGFGTYGPYKDFKCFDQIAQATGGAMSVTGMPDGIPIRSGATFGDTGSGMTLAMQILAAYIQRERTGEGQMVEVAMQEAVSNFVRTALSFRERSGHPAPRRANRSGAGGAPTDLFPALPVARTITSM
ncbi:MAG: CaiB/BaiF CoA-transferase family protein [Dehalococcoidia bacterium]